MQSPAHHTSVCEQVCKYCNQMYEFCHHHNKGKKKEEILILNKKLGVKRLDQ